MKRGGEAETRSSALQSQFGQRDYGSPSSSRDCAGTADFFDIEGEGTRFLGLMTRLFSLTYDPALYTIRWRVPYHAFRRGPKMKGGLPSRFGSGHQHHRYN